MFLLNWIKEAPTKPLIKDTHQVRKQYRFWRNEILYTSMVGYAIFYMVRKNLSAAMPGIEEDLGITKLQLGAFLTAHGLLYGLSKLCNGYLADRANPRIFMATGLILCAVMNFGFGMSETALWMGLFWMANGWFQGMGFPPCVKMLTHWFSLKERATKFSIWNVGHSLGAAIIVPLAGWLTVYYGWRYAFYVPGVIALGGAAMLLLTLRDIPETMGLPAVGVYEKLHRGEINDIAEVSDEEEQQSESLDKAISGKEYNAFVMKHVFLNPWVWLVSIAMFFVYVMRYAILDWGPTFLKESAGFELESAAGLTALFEVMGIAGVLCSGFITDKFFRGHASRTCLGYMVLCGVALWLFWQLPDNMVGLKVSCLIASGFFIYGPQCLVSVIAANLATRRAASTAVGLTGFCAYLSTIVSGVLLGGLVKAYGWNVAFGMMFGAATVAALLFFIGCFTDDSGQHDLEGS
ncbi:MFS transporter [Poriferisphaera sp. WC338]|uniref:MFS transporter n=1 Tax=Poriferisphaera sp. WC338 TaxID=3425129 RepID=UPI003D812F9D